MNNLLVCQISRTMVVFSMTQNTFDINSVRQIEALKSEIGLEEASRLGFISEDENGVTGLTAVGLSYLLFVKAVGVQSVPEAFAAGWHYADEYRQSNS